jgi:type II secretory pathway component PulF
MGLHTSIGNFVSPVLALFGVGTAADLFAYCLLWLVVFFVLVAGVAWAVYECFSAPLRGKERTRMFLNLIEAGFRQGRRPEVSLAEAAQTNDPSLDKRFGQLALRLRDGVRLSEALDDVPTLVPPQTAALVRVGEEIGDLRRVLPACRGLLRDANSQTRNGFNYLAIASLVIMPVMPVLILLLNIVIFPKFVEITQSYNQPTPALTLLVMRIGFWVAAMQILLTLFLWGCIAFYLHGPRAYGPVRVDGRKAPRRRPLLKTPLWNFVGPWLVPLRDRILYALPWRKRRLQRDFCAALALLLDAEIPEPKAVVLAAEATANYVFISRARRALEDLGAGNNLQTALRRFDGSGEFDWRLANATAQEGGFEPALAGWMEALDAKAFQQEQTFSQLFTTGLVLSNGLVTGLIAAGVFTVLISLMQ